MVGWVYTGCASIEHHTWHILVFAELPARPMEVYCKSCKPARLTDMHKYHESALLLVDCSFFPFTAPQYISMLTEEF